MLQPKDENIRETKTTNESSFGNRGSQSNTAQDQDNGNGQSQPSFQPPVINLPKGGGVIIQGINEKFQANPVTGTGSITVPLALSPSRGGFTLQLALSYDSGAGNSPFGLGWNIGLPAISRKIQSGLPQYAGLPQYYDACKSDFFVLSGAEDLVDRTEHLDKCEILPIDGLNEVILGACIIA